MCELQKPIIYSLVTNLSGKLLQTQADNDNYNIK